MKRRTAVLGAVAVTAAAGGAGMALWRSRTPAEHAALWALQFEQPGGGRLSMSTLRGRPLLLNFWATWCPPCVAELPLLDRFHRAQQSRGWQVVGLAVDQLAAVSAFLQKRPVGFVIGLAGLDGIELARSLGNTAGGGLPFTAVFDSAGRLIDRKLGVVTEDELQRWVATAR